MRMLLCLFAAAALAQTPAQPQAGPQESAAFERILVVVPLTGAGTYADPKRPALTPREFSRNGRGILEWSWEPTADGKLAIVEMVAADRQAFAPILADRQIVKAFEKGKHTRDEVEKEVRKLRPDYSIDRQIGRPR